MTFIGVALSLLDVAQFWYGWTLVFTIMTVVLLAVLKAAAVSIRTCASGEDRVTIDYFVQQLSHRLAPELFFDLAGDFFMYSVVRTVNALARK